MNSSNNKLSLEKFVDRITELTPRLCRAMIAQEERSTAVARLAMQEIWALEIIGHAGLCPRRLILQALRLKPSSGTVFLDRLERSGFIRRRRPSEDRRAVWIELSARGRRVIAQARQSRRAALRLLFQPLPPKRRAEYLAMLNEISERFDRL